MIVGLGNPGAQYAFTRHNLGFMVVDAIVAAGSGSFYTKHESLLSKYSEGDSSALLVKPTTFMNNSGRPVAAVAASVEAAPSDILVICDDFNLPSGRLRLRRAGSSGGHNGLRSVAEALATTDFPRLRIGIGSPGRMSPEKFVLTEFKRSEEKIAQEAVSDAADAALYWLEEGIDVAMNRFNAEEQ